MGLAVARGLIAEGARVALLARDRNRLDSAAAVLRTSDTAADVITVVADTTDDASVRRAIDAVAHTWGGVDILVNCAAQPSFRSTPPALAELTDAEVADDFDTKVLGYLRCARAVAPYMTQQRNGRIVNVSGLNALRTGSISGTIRNVAVAALSANLADELGPFGIGVTTVHPGMVVTERTPQLIADMAMAGGLDEEQIRKRLGATTSQHRLVDAAEVADVIVFLCSPKAAAITGDSVTVAAGDRGRVRY
ncbi:UNVERIFIED_ORG: NADP-dependent 3-hydroxy acid dehydrogenase YdfG [Gordonia westfalica J30]